MFGAPKWHPPKNWETGGAPVLDSHRSLVYTTINRMMVLAAGGALERRCGWGGTCGEDVNLLFWDANLGLEKLKIERATGHLISMASAGWEDTTTNQKSAKTMEYILGRRHAGR